MESEFTPTPLADTLPTMIGFESEQLGFPACEWTSPCYLLADRDLTKNEVVCVWAVDKIDGRVIKCVELKADGENCKRETWPAALVKAIRDNDTLVDGSKLLHAGRIKGDTFDTNAFTPTSSEFTLASSSADYNRLWVFSSRARLFTNAPFISNQVIAHNLADVEFGTAQRLCVQVRDSISQHLHESMMIDVAQAKDARGRAEDFCRGVAEKSQMMRVGVLGEDSVSISIENQANALWVPQHSGLSVSVDSASWVAHGDFTASRALAANEILRIYVHDDITGLPMPGSPMFFTAGTDTCEMINWPTALAAALMSSAIGNYLRLDLSSDTSSVNGKWKRAGIPLRIWMSEPLQESRDWVPMLPECGQEDRASTVKQWFSGRDSYVSKAAVCVIELQDRRTGGFHHRWELSASDLGDFIEKLSTALSEARFFEFRLGTAQSCHATAMENPDAAAFWLPAEFGVSALVYWKTKKPYKTDRSDIRLSHPPKFIWGVFNFGYAVGPYLCTGDTLTSPLPDDKSLQLRLESPLIGAGVRIVPCMDGMKTACLHFLTPTDIATPSVTGAFITKEAPWYSPFRIEVSNAFDVIASFKPEDTLCADRCMTLGAHVYDTGGAQENGVDENTGLFHAHYPVATLRGLGGNGPELDLTLHYSAVRANEGALGDGWAFRFSYFDNRRRILTLSTGQTVSLTKTEMRRLSASKADYLDKEGFRITGVEGNEDSFTALTIQTPGGELGREEVLAIPTVHDNKEAGEAFKKQYKEKLEKIIQQLTRWIEKESITSDQAEEFKRQRTAWQEELPEIERTALLLVTSSVRSPQGDELYLKWEGVEGHVKLLSITAPASKQNPASILLLQATHERTATQGTCKSTFHIWPDTPESYVVELEIKNCLLSSLRRFRKGGEATPERHIQFGYEMDFALDRMLTSVVEEDGSIEVVRYVATSENTSPRVQVHTLIPGVGQLCITHTYQWKGGYGVQQVRKRLHDSTQAFGRLVHQIDWSLQKSSRLVSNVFENIPGGLRRTRSFEYQTSVLENEHKQFALSRCCKFSSTVETLPDWGFQESRAEAYLEVFKNVAVDHGEKFIRVEDFWLYDEPLMDFESIYVGWARGMDGFNAHNIASYYRDIIGRYHSYLCDLDLDLNYYERGELMEELFARSLAKAMRRVLLEESQ